MFCVMISCVISSTVRACGERSCSSHFIFALPFLSCAHPFLQPSIPPFRHREEEEEEKDEELQKAELSRQASERYFSRIGFQGVES